MAGKKKAAPSPYSGSMYDPSKVLTGRELANAADNLANQQYQPQITAATSQIDQTGRNRDEAMRRLSGYYDKIQEGYNKPANEVVSAADALKGVGQAGVNAVNNMESQAQKDRLSGVANNLRDYLANSINIQSQGVAGARVAAGARGQEHLATSDRSFEGQLAGQREKLSGLNSQYQLARTTNLNNLRDREFNKLATQAQLDTAQQKVLNAKTQAELDRALRQKALAETQLHNRNSESTAAQKLALEIDKAAKGDRQKSALIDSLASTHIPTLLGLNGHKTDNANQVVDWFVSHGVSNGTGAKSAVSPEMVRAALKAWHSKYKSRKNK